ncbi:hypothetical protein HZH68_007601 [Vespula germanica]|uniref:Uncharacterized protein n=1 Tax=Vespula germanica TaxID=30212 RepID=A0A834K7X4_VESGE|nr:hypothetical protein HZH68_007601 [Vespula germanica]
MGGMGWIEWGRLEVESPQKVHEGLAKYLRRTDERSERLDGKVPNWNGRKSQNKIGRIAFEDPGKMTKAEIKKEPTQR